jgi:sugar phosphate permease
MSQMDSVFMLFYAGDKIVQLLDLDDFLIRDLTYYGKLLLLCEVGSFFSGSLGDRYHAPTIVGVGLIGSGLAILFLAVGFWTNFIAIDLAVSNLFFLVS